MYSRDWSVCIICGCELHCPADSLQNNGIEIYDNFLKLVDEFRRLDALPMKLSFQDDITPHIFLQHRAKWHKACHLKFVKSKLTRILKPKKRSREPSTSEMNSKRLARSVPDETVQGL